MGVQYCPHSGVVCLKEWYRLLNAALKDDREITFFVSEGMKKAFELSTKCLAYTLLYPVVQDSKF